MLIIHADAGVNNVHPNVDEKQNTYNWDRGITLTKGKRRKSIINIIL